MLEREREVDLVSVIPLEFARQREAFHNILRILALMPGKQGDTLREAQAELAARSISGDHDLEALCGVRN
jgi:hypothetical protein